MAMRERAAWRGHVKYFLARQGMLRREKLRQSSGAHRRFSRRRGHWRDTLRRGLKLPA